MTDLSSRLRDLIERSLPDLDLDAIVARRRRHRLRRRTITASLVAVLIAAIAGVGALQIASPGHHLGRVEVSGAGVPTEQTLERLVIASPGGLGGGAITGGSIGPM